MAEPINLPPLHVHAVSVTVQPPPNSIVGPAEMLLQQGENGGVQIDVFWRDAMGNEVHESKEMQEKEYEALRARYLHSEQASLPSFSSFKSGNTVGRVVGETASAEVPASQANPPIEAETEEEGISGEQILDGIQLGLDVVGLIPVFGEIADLANAGVSAARGDYVGAGLSLLSAIPFVGYAGTAGKATRYGAKMAETSGKAGKEIADRTAKEAAARKTKEEAARTQGQTSSKHGNGGRVAQSRRFDAECFNMPDGVSEDEFLRQLQEQEDAINRMDADTLLENRQKIDDAGSTKSLRNKEVKAKQREARLNYEAMRKIELNAIGIKGQKAKEAIKEELKKLVATHRLDMIAGGNPRDISGMGDKRINSSLGPQWSGRRADALEKYAQNLKSNGHGKNKMNVKLKKC
ncbi:Novel toxin 15 [Pseudomonas sp. IT-P2]|jgi:hypothetical protein|uniref:polymorphic toxin type 15 domain-containing protein n=1 Tax=Pseudomonas sp. IT-P2 TaxID=3026456 RepID=UPI0039E15AE1